MKLQNAELKNRLSQRLRRIQGQVGGIETMLDEQRDCKEIVQQLAAVQSALHGFARVLLEEYAVECFLDQDGALGDRRAKENALRELVDLASRTA
jgi:CsoR family transcriptional regulator, copper-sensing transcriptional repressor